MEQQPSLPPAHTKKRTNILTFLPWGILVIILLAIAVVGAVFFATGKLTYSPNGPTVAVCGDAMVKSYNDAFFYKQRGSDPQVLTLDDAGLNTIQKQIKASNGYASDPTCQTMLFWIAIQHNDSAAGQTALTALNTLHDEHKYVDSNLSGNAPLSTFKATLDNITITQGK